MSIWWEDVANLEHQQNQIARMGADKGEGRGDSSPKSEGRRGRPPEIAIFLFFKELTKSFFQDFQNKETEIRGEIGIWESVGMTDQNPSPQSKPRGGSNDSTLRLAYNPNSPEQWILETDINYNELV